MKASKWVAIGSVVLIVLLIAAVVIINSWYESGNVRVMDGRLRAELSGVGYVISHETGEVTGQALLEVNGRSASADKEQFNGDLLVMGYINEADGVMTSNKSVQKGEDGYWEIVQLENCQHIEHKEDGTSEVVNHSCKYSYVFYVHPEQQDFLVVRVKDKYAMFPQYVVMADSEEEALRIYQDFVNAGK